MITPYRLVITNFANNPALRTLPKNLVRNVNNYSNSGNGTSGFSWSPAVMFILPPVKK
jgi:hypothetical protein